MENVKWLLRLGLLYRATRLTICLAKKRQSFLKMQAQTGFLENFPQLVEVFAK